jgi:multiple sugar transport system substrate-binding protein
VGVALPPTAPGVLEDATTGAGYLGYYDGAAFGIPTGSANKQATLLWLQYLGQPTVQPAWAVTSGRLVHLSTFDDPLVQAQNNKLNGYYSLMKKQGHLFAGAPPFPFHTQVRDLLATFIYQAIRGELTPDQALDQAALAVDRKLVQLGYGK